MKKIALLLVLCICTFSFANNDKYRLILNSDPSTTMMVAWNQISGSNPVVYYDTIDHGNNNHNLYAFSKTVDRSTSYKGMENKFASLTGLTPDTNYYFIIRDSQGNSDRFWFRTAPSDLSRLSFIAGGDSRNNREPRQDANLLVSKLKPHAVIFGGDMTNTSSNVQWQEWFDDWQLTTASNGRMFPIIPARGNHENPNNVYNLFNTTANSDSYYAITFGDDLFRIYTLNSEISVSGNQKTWLENDIAANIDVLWKSAQYHKPMRPHYTGKSEGDGQYNAWAQTFYDTGVRLVMESDTHTVKTTWPLEPSSEAGNDMGFIRNDFNGTVYVGEGCWGAPTRAADDGKDWTRNMGQFNQFKLIWVSETEIEVRTIAVDNATNVGENTDTNPFNIPTNLDIWNPSEGAVVTILPAAIPNFPSIEFTAGTQTDYTDGTDLSFGVDVIEEGEGITKVDFYINGNLTSTDTSNPYSFTNTYTDGNYTIQAIATASDGGTSSPVNLTINVGNFSVNNEFIAIIDVNDDVEENGVDQSIYFTSSDLELVYDDTERGYQKIGLRFQDLNIPQGANITNAYIQFMADGNWTNADAEYTISIENTDNSESFENNASANLTGRNYIVNTVNWAPPSWIDDDAGVDQQTPNLASILQPIINLETWEQGNNTSFKIEAAGESTTNPNAKRRAESLNGNYATRLYYSYSYNAAAPIIEFDSDLETNYTDGTNINLNIDVLDNGNGITKVDFYIDGVLTSTDNTAPYRLTKNYSEDSYKIEAVATDNSGAIGSSVIFINVGIFSVNGTNAISNGNDDVEESEAGRVYFNSSDLEMVYDSHSEFGVANGYQKIGLRFQELNIPNGATITSAYIQFRSDEVNEAAASLLIYAEDTNDALAFEDNSSLNVSARQLVGDVVSWNPAPWSTTETTGTDQQTSDISDLLQVVVNRCDWNQGNSSVFIIEGSGISKTNINAKRVGDSYEGNAGNAAELVYTYTYDATLIGPKETEFTGGSWSNGMPTIYSNVKISENYNTITPGNGSITACSCEIETGKVVTVEAGDYLDINRDIIVNGSLLIKDDGSVLQRDANGLVTNSGNIQVERITTTLSDRGFTILGSPMSGETREDVYGSASLVRYHSTQNFTPNPNIENDYPLAENFADDNGDNWLPHSGDLITGEGYLVKPFIIGESGGTYTTNYTKGTLNNGTITFNAEYGDNQNDSPNILSNPYPSAIDAYKFIEVNNIVEAVYFWEHIEDPVTGYPGYNNANYDMGDISLYTMSGGIAASNQGGGIQASNQYIPSGQGFAIKANAQGPVTFNNTMRIKDNNSGYRNSEEVIDRLYLNIESNSYDLSGGALVAFTEGATNLFDKKYDANRLATPLSIYSLNDDRELVIQGRTSFKDEHIIPIGFSTQIEEYHEYTISINALEGELINQATVYLQDNLLHTYTNLSEVDYNFKANAGDQNDRFIIVFEETILNNTDFNTNAVVVYPNPTHNILNIASPFESIVRVEIFDLRGRLITTNNIEYKNNIDMDISYFKNAIYFLKVTTKNGSITKRIIKN